jgi:hypothetical protein
LGKKQQNEEPLNMRFEKPYTKPRPSEKSLFDHTKSNPNITNIRQFTDFARDTSNPDTPISMIKKYYEDNLSACKEIDSKQTKEFIEHVKQTSTINVDKSRIYDDFFKQFNQLLEDEKGVKEITMFNLINYYDTLIHGRRSDLLHPNFINFLYNNSQGHTPNTTAIIPTASDNISPNCYLYGDVSDSISNINTLSNLHCMNLFANSPASLSGSMQMLLGSPLYSCQVKKINNTTFSDAVKHYGYKM